MTREPMKQIDVVAAVIRRGDRVLIARRAPGEHLAGKWEFPGGKVEANETPEESLKRELEEEFGVTVRVGAYLTQTVHDYPGKRIRLMAYEAEHASGDLRLTVHDQVKWVASKDLAKQDLAPADVPIAEYLRLRISGMSNGMNK